MGTPIFIAALVTIVKLCKQPKCPRTGEWNRKIWGVCIHIYMYTHIYTHTHVYRQWATTTTQLFKGQKTFENMFKFQPRMAHTKKTPKQVLEMKWKRNFVTPLMRM